MRDRHLKFHEDRDNLYTLEVGAVSANGGPPMQITDVVLGLAAGVGIDLSPGSLRAAARQPTAEEVEEGAEGVDEGAELVLAADEELTDVEEAPLEAGLADVEVTDD